MESLSNFGFVEIDSKWAIPRLLAALDYEEETKLHEFAIRVNDRYDAPIKSGMLWWKSVHWRTLEEAWKAARRCDFWQNSEFYYSYEWHIRSEILPKIKRTIIAASEQPKFFVSLQDYPDLFREPYRLNHGEKREPQ